jgi:4-hydroxybenzoate polyprenyltransferase
MADLKTFAQLTRFPNVFTAASNILGAYLLTHTGLGDWPTWAALVASSCCLYMAGMVLNDVFDVDQDADERPFRPIPSGRVTESGAKTLGWGLLAAGVLFAAATSVRLQSAAPVSVALLLAVCVWLYDGVLKQTPLAPLFMGICRFLNVLLGFSPVVIGTFDLHPMFWVIAVGVGVYTAGITWFARGEARAGASRLRLLLALIVMLSGIALLAWFPQWEDSLLPLEAYPKKALDMGFAWYVLWGLFGLVTIRRGSTALAVPEPEYVQATVKQAIFSLVIYDATICAAARGPIPYALVILALLIPMNLLGRWVYST